MKSPGADSAAPPIDPLAPDDAQDPGDPPEQADAEDPGDPQDPGGAPKAAGWASAARRGATAPRKGGTAARRGGGVALTALDGLLAVGAGVLVILVHDMHYILSQPYWLDEAWVADSVRAPLGLVPRLASSTPVGWTLLLRLVSGDGLQRQRLVPLIFAGLAVAAGYLLGRELRLTRFAAGLLTAAAVLLSPAMLSRDDLKQYTAEAFLALLLWLLVARLENRWSRWRLAAVALATSLGPLLAGTAIFTGGAAFACLCLETLIRRRWRQLAEVAVAGAGALAIYGVVFALVVRPRLDPTLSTYWAPWYSPAGVPGAARFFWARLQQLSPFIGFPAAGVPSPALLAIRHVTSGVDVGPVPLAVPLSLAGAGIAALAVLRRFALAALLPVTLVVVMTASAARQYPFGDERTSTFWLVLVPVLAAIAVAAAIHGLGRALRWLDYRLKWALPVIAVAGGAVAISFYLQQVRPYVNAGQLLAHDDTRSQVAYAQAHYRPGDVFVVDNGASYAFAYYYQVPAAGYPVLPGNAAGFVPQYPRDAHVIIMTSRDAAACGPAMRAAIAAVYAEPASEQGRVWVIREHGSRAELIAWRAIFTSLNSRGGHVAIIDLSELGYAPAYQPVALYTPPPRARPSP